MEWQGKGQDTHPYQTRVGQPRKMRLQIRKTPLAAKALVFFNVRFTDGKNFSITCHPVMVTDTVDFSDIKTGDDVIIREYYRRREDGEETRP
jgi:hypothetical protein